MAKRKRKKDDKPKRPVGRPPKEFTDEQEERIAQLAEEGRHTRTIAECLGVDKDTLTRHFGPLIKKRRAIGRAKIGAAQYQAALAGDHTMLVWLGKNRLDQTDKAQIEQTHKIDGWEIVGTVKAETDAASDAG